MHHLHKAGQVRPKHHPMHDAFPSTVNQELGIALGGGQQGTACIWPGPSLARRVTSIMASQLQATPRDIDFTIRRQKLTTHPPQLLA